VIALVDYGAGNLTSVRKALAAVGARVFTPERAGDLETASGIIVPGVGHFGATRALGADWRAGVRAALERGAPLLGICVGLQWLFEGSAEAPGVAGLGMLPGVCARVGDPAGALKVPHVGWNDLALPRDTRLLRGLANGTQVYFTHSYAAPVVGATAAATDYGVTFSAAVEDGLVSGVQFHPEKSGDAGLRILRNWIDAV
jgi:glutamine amidotransferase